MKIITKMIVVAASLTGASVAWATNDRADATKIGINNSTGSDIVVCFSQSNGAGISTIQQVSVNGGASYTVEPATTSPCLSTEITVFPQKDVKGLTCSAQQGGGGSNWDKVSLTSVQGVTWTLARDWPVDPTWSSFQCLNNCDCSGVGCEILVDVTAVKKN